MWLALTAMTLANSMVLVDQTAVPLATPDVVRDLNAREDLAGKVEKLLAESGK